MFAFEIPGLRFSLPAGADVERCRFVSVNADSNGVPATAGTPVIGVSMNKAAAGQVLEIADGIVMVEAGDAVDAGAAVVANGDGMAIAGEGTAVALTAATAAGELITVKL
jgi:hypothetical protein